MLLAMAFDHFVAMYSPLRYIIVLTPSLFLRWAWLLWLEGSTDDPLAHSAQQLPFCRNIVLS